MSNGSRREYEDRPDDHQAGIPPEEAHPDQTNQWGETRPGFLEADTIAHCGSALGGMFVYTVNTVDIATQWTEQRAVRGKGERGVREPLRDIEHSLPFRIRGFDCDNGSEFLNWTSLKY